MNELVELPSEKCEELLRASIVGRVVFETGAGAQIVPVNYTTVDDAVVFRTSPYSQLGTHVDGRRLVFEIDQIDHEGHRGWSVVAVGTGEIVEDPAELATAGPFWNPRPWAAGQRVLYVRIPWRQLTGRRIGSGWTWEDELPVRRR